MIQSDSDAREVLDWPRGAQMDAPGGPICWCGKPSRLESGWCGLCTEIKSTPPSVSLPLPLAQRILAALEAEAELSLSPSLRALAAELRAVIGK